jgi:cell division septation protein DedD
MAEARITPADVPQSGLAMQSIAAAASAPPVAVAVAAPSVPVASAPALAVAQAEAAASTSRVSKGVVQAASAPLVPAPVAVPVEAAPEVAPKPLEKSKPAQASKATKTGKHSAPAQHKTETRAPAPPPANTDTYLINVGLFADENNARNASTKLKDAGLPVLSSTLHSAKGLKPRPKQTAPQKKSTLFSWMRWWSSPRSPRAI